MKRAYRRYNSRYKERIIVSKPKKNEAHKTKRGESVYKEIPNIADGFEDDCKTLIETFLQRDCIRYTTFYQLWQETNFELIFSGRPSMQELHEFFNEAINIAAKFFFNSSTEDNYQRCIAGLYLVYSIHRIDRLTHSARVRVLPSSAKILQEIQTHARECGHLDLLYILCSMLRDGVFRFVATTREYGLEFSFWKYIDRDLGENVYDQHTNNKNEKVKFSLDVDLLNELKETFDTYHNIKCRLKGADGDNPPKELSYVDGTFPTTVMNSVKAVLNDEEDKDKQYSQMKLAIKHKSKEILSRTHKPSNDLSSNQNTNYHSSSISANSIGECMTEMRESEDEDVAVSNTTYGDEVLSVPNVIIEIINETEGIDDVN